MKIIALIALLVMPAMATEVRLQPTPGTSEERNHRLGEAIVLEATVEPTQWQASKTSNSVVANVATSGFSIDTSVRLETMVGFHQFYGPSEDLDEAIGWTGSITSCDEGMVSEGYHDAVLRRINYYRAQAGLASDIYFDASKNTKCQRAAMVMSREKNLSHTPLKDFVGNPCVRVCNAYRAGKGNVRLFDHSCNCGIYFS